MYIVNTTSIRTTKYMNNVLAKQSSKAAAPSENIIIVTQRHVITKIGGSLKFIQ